MSGKARSRSTSIVLLLVAAVVAAIGLVNAAAGPTCGREAMSPGDTCLFDGAPSSYADRVDASRNAPLINGLVALVLVGFAVGCRPRGDPGPARPAAPRASSGAADGVAAGGRVATAAPPLARTPAEAHLAISLSLCRCGTADVPRESALYRVPGGFIRRYSGPCRTCGTPREFSYRLLEEPPVAGPGGFRYGDGTPSELIDPGVWLAVADQYARRTPVDGARLDAAERRAARLDIARAAAAMDEVIAFIPRSGTAVPASAFVTEAGRRIRDREPGRFGRARLEVVRDTYRQIVAELTDPRPDRTA